MNSMKVQIKSIKNSKKIGKFLLDINDETIEISSDIIVKYQLHKDKELNEDVLKQITYDLNVEKYYNLLVKKLSNTMKSTYEIKEILNSYDISKDVYKSIFDKLVINGFINDKVLAKSIFDSSIALKKSPMYYQTKMKQKGLDEYLSIYKYTNDIETSILNDLLVNYKSDDTLPLIKQKEVLLSKLINKGFTYYTVIKAMANYKFIDNSSNNLKEKIDKYIKKSNTLNKDKIVYKFMQLGYNYNEIIKYI